MNNAPAFQDFLPQGDEITVLQDQIRKGRMVHALLITGEDGTYELYDWKRSNKVDPNDTNQWSNGINGLEHLSDTSYIHYCLQQNLYRYMLEKNYGIKINRMNLVVLHPDFMSYKVVPVPIMNREVRIIVDFIKK